MKTAISIPDPLFQAAEKLAKERKLSRSELYRRAIAEFVKRAREAELVKLIDKSCDEEDRSLDEFRREAAKRTVASTEW